MTLETIHIAVLYVLALLLTISTGTLWLRTRRYRQNTQEILHELGTTYEGQWRIWESRQDEMERITAELTLAREQQEDVLRRSAGHRSERKEILANLRTGARPDAIAAKIALPRNDVRLLSKVQNIIAASLNPGASSVRIAPPKINN